MLPAPGLSRRAVLARVSAYGLTVFGVPALWRTVLPPPEDPADDGGKDGEDGAGGKPGQQRARARSDDRLLAIGKVPFSSGPLKKIRREKPDYIFLGDSMVSVLIDPAEMDRLTGRKSTVVHLPGSTSARWYLMFKNYVLASGVKPRVVFYFFRDCLWHMPHFRTEGAFWDEIERLMPEESDAVITKILGTEKKGAGSLLSRFFNDTVYPVQSARPRASAALERLSAALAGQDASRMRDHANALFGFQHYRRGLDVEGQLGQTQHSGLNDIVPFTENPAMTFLPHVLDMAQAAEVRLFFVRVKRRPPRIREKGDPAELADYTAKLRAWLLGRGAGFHDFSADPEIRSDMFGEGDHLDLQHMTWFTRRLHSLLGEAFA